MPIFQPVDGARTVTEEVELVGKTWEQDGRPSLREVGERWQQRRDWAQLRIDCYTAPEDVKGILTARGGVQGMSLVQRINRVREPAAFRAWLIQAAKDGIGMDRLRPFVEIKDRRFRAQVAAAAKKGASFTELQAMLDEYGGTETGITHKLDKTIEVLRRLDGEIGTVHNAEWGRQLAEITTLATRIARRLK